MQLLSRDKYEDRLRTRAAFHVSDTECLFGSFDGHFASDAPCPLTPKSGIPATIGDRSLDPLAIKPHSILSILRIPIYIFDTPAISD